MKPAENTEKLIKNLNLDIDINEKTDLRILKELIEAHEKSKKMHSALIEPNIRRTIMKNPITKLAAAAVVIIAVTISINQFGSPTTSVVWGDVLKKVQASRGLIYRERTFHSDKANDTGYIMFYDCPTRSRMDTFKAGQITRSLYCDYEKKTVLCIVHEDKICANIPMDERDVQDHNREMNLKGWVQKVVAQEHTKLGRKKIDSIICEGLETKYPIFGEFNPSVDNKVTRVWVSVQTMYPVLCESGHINEDNKLQIEVVLDQFQWDVKLDPSEFEPNIPPDYHQM